MCYVLWCGCGRGLADGLVGDVMCKDLGDKQVSCGIIFTVGDRRFAASVYAVLASAVIMI